MTVYCLRGAAPFGLQCYIKIKINHPSISMTQGNQLVLPLPPAPQPLTSQRYYEIHDILERYAQEYHLVILQIFQILPKKQETQPKVLSCTKLVIMTPWRALCVDRIGKYTLKGKDNTSINFMCLTMIDPATSWFQMIELMTVTKIDCPQHRQG